MFSAKPGSRSGKLEAGCQTRATDPSRDLRRSPTVLVERTVEWPDRREKFLRRKKNIALNPFATSPRPREDT